MSNLFLGQSDDIPTPDPINGVDYLTKLHKYLQVNATKLSPSLPSRSSYGNTPTILQQSYTLLTLGLDPNSAPLSKSLKIPLTLGFGQPSTSSNTPASNKRIISKSIKPLLLRLPPDRLLYLLLRWQSLPQSLNHVGRTDVPIEEGVPVAARGARINERNTPGIEGDVRSVRSWVGSMRSVSMGSLVSREGGRGWFGRKEEINEDQILLQLYSMFTLLPALLIHPPFVSEPPILELIEAGGYTQLGGIDVRVPLDVLRNLQILELEGYDPRALLIPPNPGMRSLTVKDVQDGDDWIEELLTIPPADNLNQSSPDDSESINDIPAKARFPNLEHLSLVSTTLLNFPLLPLTSLTHLDLSNNLLDSVPTSLSGLTSMTSLNLSNNVITSLRSTSNIIPYINSINLSGNRIDCLVGLEGCFNLERIDLRKNELIDVGEIGRLSILPKIKKVWCRNNGFDIAGEDQWRVDLGILFKLEGNSHIVLDDMEFTWNEQRKIDVELEKRGRLNGNNTVYSPNPNNQHLHTTSYSYSTSASSMVSPYNNGHQDSRATSKQPSNDDRSRFDSVNSNYQQRLSTTTTNQPTTKSIKSPASSASAIAKKKSKRRVINLDSPNDISLTSSSNLQNALEGSLRGSLKVPGKVIEEDEDQDQGQEVAVEENRVNGENGDTPKIDSTANNGIDNGINGNSDENRDEIKDEGRPVIASQSHQNIQHDELPSPPPPVQQSIKVASSKRKNGRKGLKKDTFDPIQ